MDKKIIIIIIVIFALLICFFIFVHFFTNKEDHCYDIEGKCNEVFSSWSS